jgi:hypothetical protein
MIRKGDFSRPVAHHPTPRHARVENVCGLRPGAVWSTAEAAAGRATSVAHHTTPRHARVENVCGLRAGEWFGRQLKQPLRRGVFCYSSFCFFQSSAGCS